MKSLVASCFVAGFIFAASDPCEALSHITQLRPENLADNLVSVQVTNTEFGMRFTVLYREREKDLDQFLHPILEVNDEDNRIASCEVTKNWKANGVEFTFTIVPAYLEASKFRLVEGAHAGRETMPAFTEYWFYLRDFAPNESGPARRSASNHVPPETLKELAGRVRALRPGLTADQVWNELGILSYKNRLGEISSAEHDRRWLTWNYEIEFIYARPKGSKQPDAGDQSSLDPNLWKLVRANLFKNGREISRSGK